MSVTGRRPFLEEIDDVYDPTSPQFHRGLIFLSGKVDDLFYYNYQLPDVNLTHLLFHHFKDCVDIIAWYDLGEGLVYEQGGIVAEPVSSPSEPEPAEAFDPLDPATVVRGSKRNSQVRTPSTKGGKHKGRPVDAIKEVDERLRTETKQRMLVLFTGAEIWDVHTQEEPEIVRLVASWPDLCWNHEHLAIFAGTSLSRSDFNLFGNYRGIKHIKIGGPVLDEVKKRFLLEYARTGKEIFEWTQLDEIANVFVEKGALREEGYRSFLSSLKYAKGIFDKEFVEANSTQGTQFDFKKMDIQGLEAHLKSEIIGQDFVKKELSDKLSILTRFGKQDQNKPIFAAMFVGPSGVGKTEIAEQLSEHLFKRRSCVVKCGELKSEADIWGLLGTPPGYAGQDKKGPIYNYLQERPYGLILLDEFERAHEAIHDAFMNILDKGLTTNKQDEVIDCRNTIIILTSNAGKELIDEKGIEHGREARIKLYKDYFSQNYGSHITGRITDFFVFDFLTDEQLKEIAKLRLDKTINNYLSRPDAPQIEIEVGESVYDKILSKIDRREGARGIQNACAGLTNKILLYAIGHPETEQFDVKTVDTHIHINLDKLEDF
jgi:DNA polymerase III delta prime subunit